jgi:hypothetical protein
MTQEEFPSEESEKLGTEETTKTNSFEPPNWIDNSSYWIHTFPQLSDEWFFEHQNRLTSSNFASALGWSDNITIEELRESIQYYKPLTVDSRKKIMKLHGVATESTGRNWYIKRFGAKVSEVGLAVPKWEPRIGCSADGIIEGENGIIEIKCPYFLYSGQFFSYQSLSTLITPSKTISLKSLLSLTVTKTRFTSITQSYFFLRICFNTILELITSGFSYVYI